MNIFEDFYFKYGVLCGFMDLDNGNKGILYIQPHRFQPTSASDEAGEIGLGVIYWAIARFPNFNLAEQEWEDFDSPFSVVRGATLADAISSVGVFGREVNWVSNPGVVAAIQRIFIDPMYVRIDCLPDSLPEFQVSMVSELFDHIPRVPITSVTQLARLLRVLDYVPESISNPGLVRPWQNRETARSQWAHVVRKVNAAFDHGNMGHGQSTPSHHEGRKNSLWSKVLRRGQAPASAEVPSTQVVGDGMSQIRATNWMIETLDWSGFVLSVSRYQPGFEGDSQGNIDSVSENGRD